MSTPSLPDFPKRTALNLKIARYRALAEAHPGGEHATFVRGCKWCRINKEENR